VLIYRVSYSLSVFVTQHFLSCASEAFSVKRTNVNDHHLFEPYTSFHCVHLEIPKNSHVTTFSMLCTVFAKISNLTVMVSAIKYYKRRL